MHGFSLWSFHSLSLFLFFMFANLILSVQRFDSVVKFLLFFPELWAIVNNAGILKGFDVELTDLEEFREVMEVNAFGPVRVTKAFLSLLRHYKGRVVNVTSIGGK